MICKDIRYIAPARNQRQRRSGETTGTRRLTHIHPPDMHKLKTEISNKELKRSCHSDSPGKFFTWT
jgi:hypothetical protein